MTEDRIPVRAWIDLVLLALLWGGSFLAIREALDEIGFLTAVAHRVTWASIMLWIIVAVRRLAVPRSLRAWGALFVMGCLNNVIPFTLMAWGQLSIESGLTAILNATSAIWAVLVAALFFADERLTMRRAIGVLIGFLGVSCAIGLQNLASLELRSLAQLAVIGGTISYAFAGCWARARLQDQSPLVAAAGMLTCSTLVMLPLSRAVEGPLAVDLSLSTWAAIAYFALAATAAAYILYYRILAAAGAGNLLLVTLMIPPVAILLGAWARDEALTSGAYLGFALLGAGLLILDGRIGNAVRKSLSR